MVDEFKPQQDEDPYEENDSNDSFEIQRDNEDVSPKLSRSPTEKPTSSSQEKGEGEEKWDLPLLDEEKYILNSDDEEESSPSPISLT